MPDARWLPRPDRPALVSGEVHVWRASLRPPPDVLRRHHATLSAGERERAARFRFDEHRERFVAGRGIQRALLGRYAGIAPEAVRYREGAHGKLELDDGRGLIRFNATNCEDRALFAVVQGRRIGVDLEAVRPVPEAESIIESFFSPAERRAFLEVPADSRDEAFFACWTRKEAFIKALGGGLSIPLDDFDVTLAPGEPARLLAVRGLSADEWTLREIDPGPGWAGALAVEGGDFVVRSFDWDLGGPPGAWPAAEP